MSIYFSSNQVPSLKELPFSERQIMINKARAKFNAAELFALNVLKLLMLIPIFFLLARQEFLTLAFCIPLVLVCYLGIFKPVFFYFLSKKIEI